MIPLPTPPTDNVYKFMTISGILLFAAGFIAFDSFWTKQQDVLRAARLQQAVDSALAADLDSDEPAIVRDMEYARTTPQRSAGLAPRAAIDTLMESLRVSQRVQQRLDSAKAVLTAVHRRNLETNARLSVAVKEMDAQKPMDRVLIGMMFSGLGLTFLGLWLWYDRVQRYHDVALRRDSERHPRTIKPSMAAFE